MPGGINSGAPPARPPRADESQPLGPDQVREELQRVLASHEFRSSKRSRDFLQYTVENTLQGRAELLKERTIGVDVFGRSADYDPGDDATVRVKAGEVRKRLGAYYADKGASNPIRIELPFGTYVPEFHLAPNVNEPASAPPLSGGLRSLLLRFQPLQHRLWAGLILAVLLLAVLVPWLLRKGDPLLDQFWAPVLKGSAPVMLCAAYVPVWNLERAPGATGPARPEEYTLLTDQFVGGGDLLATARLSALLARRGRAYRVRIGNDVSFHDLRNAPAILVGYSYTRWNDISNVLRYVLDGNREPSGVLDGGKPTRWNLPNLRPDRRTNEDYALVSRVFHPDTQAMLVEVAGITQYGTDAAAELVTNPQLLAQALKSAPPGWQKKNLQLVLHVRVISGAPANPTVVASYFW